jgi:hypothetical protein
MKSENALVRPFRAQDFWGRIITQAPLRFGLGYLRAPLWGSRAGHRRCNLEQVTIETSHRTCPRRQDGGATELPDTTFHSLEHFQEYRRCLAGDSATLPGSISRVIAIRGCRFAQPPANFWKPSGFHGSYGITSIALAHFHFS